MVANVQKGIIMEKQEFIEGLQKSFVSLLPPEYADAKLQLREVHSSRGVYQGADIIHPDGNMRIMPVLNVDQMYEGMKDMDVTSAVNKAANIYKNHLVNSKDMMYDEQMSSVVNNISDYNFVKNLLCVAVCSEAGRDILENTPHIMEEDIPIIARIVVSSMNDETASIVVSDQLLSNWNIDKETLFADAFENTAKMNPPHLVSMSDMLREMMGADFPEGMDDVFGPKMYVFINDTKVNGAASIFIPGVMDKMAEEIGGDYVIIPSSTHELILVPDQGLGSPKDILGIVDMVKEVNAHEVEPCDRIGDNAYHYDAKNKVFEQVRDYVNRLEKAEDFTPEVEENLAQEVPVKAMKM